VEDDKALLDMPDGSRRLIAVRGGGMLSGGRDSPVPPELQIPRQSFEAMWLRMVNDGEEYALPIPDEAFPIVQEYYNTHPDASYEQVRGFALVLLPRYGDRLPRALRLLMFQGELGFFEFEAELERFQAELAATGRPEPYGVFPAESYGHWEKLIARAQAIEDSFAQQGIPLPPLG